MSDWQWLQWGFETITVVSKDWLSSCCYMHQRDIFCTQNITVLWVSSLQFTPLHKQHTVVLVKTSYIITCVFYVNSLLLGVTQFTLVTPNEDLCVHCPSVTVYCQVNCMSVTLGVSTSWATAAIVFYILEKQSFTHHKSYPEKKFSSAVVCKFWILNRKLSQLHF